MIRLFALDNIRQDSQPQAALLRLLLLLFWVVAIVHLVGQQLWGSAPLSGAVNLFIGLLLSAGTVALLRLNGGGHLRLACLAGAALILAFTLLSAVFIPALPFSWLYLGVPAIAMLAFLADQRLAIVGAALIVAAGVGGAPNTGFEQLMPLLVVIPLVLLLGHHWQLTIRAREAQARTRALRIPWVERQHDNLFTPQDADQLLKFSLLLAIVDIGEIFRRAVRGVSASIPAAHYLISSFDAELGQLRERVSLIPTDESENRPQTLTTTYSLNQVPHLAAIIEEGLARYDSLLEVAVEDLYRAELRDAGFDYRLTLPLKIRDTTIGLLAIARYENQGAFSAREIELAQAMSTQIAASLENGRLAQEAQARAAQLSTLNRLSRILSENNQLSEMLVDARREVMPLFEATGFAILLYDSVAKELNWAYAFEYGAEADLSNLSAVPVTSGNAGYVATAGEPLLISELAQLEYAELAHFSAGTAEGSWLGVPLVVANKIIGVLSLENADDRAAFAQRDIDLLTTIAGPLAISINNIQQLEQTQSALAAQSEQALLLKTAAEVSATATSVLDVRELAQRVVDLIKARFNLYYVGLFLVDEGRQAAILQAATEVEGATVQREQYRLPLDSSNLITQAITVGRVHLEPEVKHDTSWAFGAYLSNTRSMLAIPLRAQRGGTVGALTVHSMVTDAFSDEAISILQTLCDQLAVAIENARLFQQVQESLIRLNNLFLASRKIMAAERAQTVYETLVDYAGASGLVDMAHLLVADPKEPDFLMIPALWSRIDVDYDPGHRYARDPLPYSPRLLQREIVLIDDVQSSPDVDGVTLAMFQHNRMHAAVLVPIYREDQWLGTLVLARSDDKPLARSESQPFLTLCNQAAAALANQQLFRESSALYRASRSLSQVITRDDALNIVAEEIMLQTMADQCRIIFYDAKDNVGKIEYERSESGLASGVQFPMGSDPVFRRLNEERQPLFLTDNGGDEVTAASYLRPFNTKTSLLIPALNQQKLMGFMALDLLQGHRNFSNTQVNFAQTLVDQLNTQLENLALFDDALSRAQEMITLNQVGVLISGTLDLERLANVVHEQVGRLVDNSIFILALYEAESQIYRPLLCTRYGERFMPVPRRIDAAESLYEFLYRGTLLAVTDDPVLSQQAGLEDLYVSGWVPESAVWVPMQQEGEPIGFLSVQSYRPDAYSENHVQLLRTIATQAGLALANAQSFQRTQTTLSEIRQLFDITQAVATSPDPQQRLSRVADALYQHFQDVDVTIFVTNEEVGVLDTVASRGPNPQARHKSLEEGLIGQSIRQGTPLIVRDLRETPEFQDSSREALSQIVIPLAFGDRVIGVINAESRYPDAFSDSDLRLLRTLSVSVAATIESGRLFQEIQLANEQLRELDRLKTQFLANMSHELRTPLNSIIGFSRVILKGIDGPVTPEQDQDLNAIYNSGRHLLTLINDILDIARIEAGKMALVFERVDIIEVANDALATARGLVQDRSVELRTRYSPELPLVDADPVRLRQMLLNLLSNAAKFTQQGHIELAIYRQGDHHIHIAVTDTGIGLAQTDFDRIFTAFEQIEKRTDQSLHGTGLGLPITKRLVDMHKGEIWVESELSRGSTFHIILPINQPGKAVAARANRLTEEPLEISQDIN